MNLKTKGLIGIAIICVLIVILVKIFGGSGEAGYISTAKQALESSMLNPATASYNSAKIIEKDDHGRAIILVDVSYETKSGGVDRGEYWVCVMKSGKDGDFYYKTYSSFCEAGADYKLDMLKSLNNWNEEQ